jgi:hypothetical protein
MKAGAGMVFSRKMRARWDQSSRGVAGGPDQRSAKGFS